MFPAPTFWCGHYSNCVRIEHGISGHGGVKYTVVYGKKANEMVNKGIWKDVVNKSNDFDDRMKQMWVGVKGILGKQEGEADTGIATGHYEHQT